MIMQPRLPKLKDGLAPDDHAHCTVKRDGFQVRIFKGERDQPARVFTRKPQEIIVPRLTEVARQHAWPGGTQVVGELWVKGGRASDVITHVKAQSDNLRFDAYAIEWMAGHEAPADRSPAHVDIALLDLGLTPARHVEPERQRIWLKDGPTKGLPQDVEGLVWKQAALSGWYRWKLERTCDLVVLDVLDGAGKNLGLIGSFQMGLHDGTWIANVGTGIDDEMRFELSKGDWSRHIGRVAEVSYQYVGSGGRLRHPRFKRWRDDKCREECTGLG